MKLPPLNALRAFEAAARHHSFSRAGDELCVTHAAISHQIKLLEAWFGCSLFHREGRGVRLTRVGQALSVRTTSVFEELAEVSLLHRVAERRQSLAVGCIPSIASRWLVPRLADFFRQHPEIDMQVLYASPHERLMQGEYDVLITLGEDASKGVRNERLFSRVNKPVCSPYYLERKGSLNSPELIAGADLLHDESKDAWREWFAEAGGEVPGLLSGPVFEDFNLLATSVIAGHGVALCPIDVFREELDRGDLTVLSDIATNTEKSYFVITQRSPSRAVEKFVEWFFASIQASSSTMKSI